MKLVKLYSNDSKFKTVTFTSGLNIVMGRINDEKNFQKDCHNLGKSRLVELIDFMLLKGLSKRSFLKHSKFKNHIFFLEIELNDGRYLTIKRSINKNTKINFKIANTRGNNFKNEKLWDYKDLPLTTDDPEKNPKNILQTLLGYNVLENINFRSYINYFLRTQNDYSDEFHLSKYRGSDSEWKPLLAAMLGFDGNKLRDKYKLDKEEINQKEYIKKLENEINLTQVDKLRGLIQIKEYEKEKLEIALSEFNFYINDKSIDKDLVEQIEDKISRLNKVRYNLELDINSLNTSIEKEVYFDLEVTLKIFKEVGIYFSDQLKKSYDELLNFNHMLTTDRNRHIATTLKRKKIQLSKVENELIILNENKKKLLGVLTETDIFKKYKNVEKELIKVERELEKYSGELDDILIINQEKDKLKSISENMEKLKKDIRFEIEETTNNLYIEIRGYFSKYVKEILGKPGLLSIDPNKSGNIDFSSEIYNSKDDITAQGDGHSYKKILCACFDLALITTYCKKSFIKFVVHDGCLETLDPRKQKKYLDLISSICKEYGIQYILTVIESDIPVIAGEKYSFPFEYNIAVELSDLNEATTLFGFEF